MPRKRKFFGKKKDNKTGRVYYVGYYRPKNYAKPDPIKIRLCSVESIASLTESEQSEHLVRLYESNNPDKEWSADVTDFGRWHADFVTHLRSKNLTAATIAYHELIARRWVDFKCGLFVKKITRSEVDRFRQGLINKGFSVHTINHALKRLKSFFSWLSEEGIIRKPIRVEMLKSFDREVVLPTKEQFSLIAREIRNRKEERGGAGDWAIFRFFVFAYYSGCRRGEITWLRLSDIDLDERVAIIRTSEKMRIKENSGLKRVILSRFLVDFLRDDLRERRDRYYLGDHPREDRPYYTEAVISRAFRRIFISVGGEALKNVKATHFLRAMLPTQLLNESNVPLSVASKLLFHSSDEVTRKYYVNFDESSLREASNKIPKLKW